MRLTLNDVLKPVAETLNLNQSQRAIYYINRAQEELLNVGRWVGTTMKYRICTVDPFITWPRDLQTIEAIRINGAPGQLNNQWYRFLDYGADFSPYYRGGNSWSAGFNFYWARGNAIDEAEAISFGDVCPTGNPKRLKVYDTATEAAGARILLQFYDATGTYVRTNDPTEGWVDGEFVAINPTSPQTTVNAVSSWVGVQKPITNGVVRITELDTVTNTERTLAVYQPSETNPAYRRTYLQGLCQACLTSPRAASVEVIGSQRFIPALCLRDYLCLSSTAAIVYKSKGVYLAENNDPNGAAIMDAMAEKALNDELSKWTGAGTIQTPRMNAQDACQIGTPNYI